MSFSSTAPRGLLWPGLATLVALAILIGLGTWQMQRLAWKSGLVTTIEARTGEKPLEIRTSAEAAALDPGRDEYRPVTLRGTFRHDADVQVYTLLSDQKGRFSGPGYWVLTPLVLADGGAVIVNRGFVPLERKDPATRAGGQVAGEQKISGLVRGPDAGNAFTPANDPVRGAWFTRDPAAIAAAFGIPKVAPLVVDADATPNAGGLPQGGETKRAFPNRHLEYALTWYGLAAALAGVFLAFAAGRLRDRPGRDRPSLESPSA